VLPYRFISSISISLVLSGAVDAEDFPWGSATARMGSISRLSSLT
jgi:hypothetical protein